MIRYNISKSQILLLLLWLLLNTFFLIHRGVYIEGESEKYIYQAHLLLTTGNVSSANFWLYTVQIILDALCLKFHIPFIMLVIIQLMLNGFATVFFYRTLLFIFQNPHIAFTGTLLLIANYFYQEFNTFLYTESTFYSLTLILSCYLIHIQKLTAKKLLLVLLLLATICITRPTGLLFIPPVFLYLFLVFFRNLSSLKKLALFSVITLGFLFLLNIALGSGGELDLMLPFRDESIVCGVPTLPGFAPITTAANSNSLYGLLYYVAHNIPQFLRLAVLRTGAFFGLYRSYFSGWHNLYLIVFFYPIYVAALASIPRWPGANSNTFYYLLSVIGMVWLTVILTCDDWHNRFYLSISPLMIILAMPILQKIMPNRERSELKIDERLAAENTE